jgi:hypothetical protein
MYRKVTNFNTYIVYSISRFLLPEAILSLKYHLVLVWEGHYSFIYIYIYIYYIKHIQKY